TVLEPGEQVTVIDNSQSYTWTVRRSGGSEIEVPSTCIWLPPADPEAVQLAIGALKLKNALRIRKQVLHFEKTETVYARTEKQTRYGVNLRRKLLNTWSQILNSLRQWIAEFFDSYLTQMLKSPVACLAKLQEHLSEWRHCSNEATEAETELQGRTALSKESSESSGAHRTAFLQEESQSKFEELQRSMQNWRLQDVKSNFKANQKAPQLLFYDKYSLSIMHSVTGPAVSTRTQYVPETTQTEEQYSINTHGRQFHTSVSDSKTTVRYSFTSSSQMATEKQQIDDTFSPEFQAAVLKYSEAHKLEFSALVSSW
uniref:SH3_10 domain-containing protein n=1 Tax=Macrostomum lignano TaxID=282301 RepID=A0A1I8HW45_9PLAT